MELNKSHSCVFFVPCYFCVSPELLLYNQTLLWTCIDLHQPIAGWNIPTYLDISSIYFSWKHKIAKCYLHASTGSGRHSVSTLYPWLCDHNLWLTARSVSLQPGEEKKNYYLKEILSFKHRFIWEQLYWMQSCSFSSLSSAWICVTDSQIKRDYHHPTQPQFLLHTHTAKAKLSHLFKTVKPVRLAHHTLDTKYSKYELLHLQSKHFSR